MNLDEPQFKLQLEYFGKWITYLPKDPILANAFGTQTGLVLGVLVTVPGFSDESTELLVGAPGEEPDFISTSEIDVIRLDWEPPKECA